MGRFVRTAWYLEKHNEQTSCKVFRALKTWEILNWIAR